MSLTATDCTRPAESDGLTFRHKIGERLEAHKTVQHTACLLCVGQVHVQSAGLFYGLQDGFLCYLMEDDTVGVGLVKTQYLAKVP